MQGVRPHIDSGVDITLMVFKTVAVARRRTRQDTEDVRLVLSIEFDGQYT